MRGSVCVAGWSVKPPNNIYLGAATSTYMYNTKSRYSYLLLIIHVHVLLMMPV